MPYLLNAKKALILARVVVAFIALSAFVWSGLVVGAQQSLAAEPPLNILVINSYDQDIPWQRSFERGFKTELGQALGGIKVFYEYLNSGNIPEHDYLNTMGPLLDSKYRSVRIDVLITESEPAYRFIANNPNLFLHAKKLFVQPGETMGFSGAAKSDTITFLDDFNAPISEMQRLVSPEKVYVIADSSTPPRKQRLRTFKAALNKEQHPFETEYLLDLPMADLLDKVSALPDHSAIFYLLIFQDGAGESFSPYQAAQRITERANAPMFTNWETLMGSGIVGGHMLSGERVGKETARHALALALGRAIDQQVKTGYGSYYDWRQLQRWKINEARLPNNASIQFYQSTLIEQYRWQVIAILSTLATLLLFTTVLLVSNLKRKKAEQALRNSEERLSLVLEGSQQGFWDWNIETGDVQRNNRWAEMLGYASIEEFEANTNTWTDNIHPDDREASWAAINDHLEGRTPIYLLEYRMFTKDGEIKWIRDQAKVVQRDATGQPKRMCGTHVDITARKEMEETLRHSEERFQNFASAASDWFWEMGPALRFSYFSEHAGERLDIFTGELIGKTRREIGQVGSNDEDWESHLADLDAHRPFRDFEYEMKNGNFVSVSGIPAFDNDGEFLGYRGTGTNITERIRADEELKAHRDHLEELVAHRTHEVQEKAAQLEAALTHEKEYNLLQNKFIALVSHEFRTPLAIIDGAAQRLLRHKASLPADELEARVSKIRSAVTRMVDQIETTLYASRLDEGKVDFVMLPCDLVSVLADVCERQSEIAPDHHIQVKTDGLPDKVRGDTKLLDQIFTNLLSNAVKYSPAASSIEVKGWRDEDEAVVSVSDQGVGIPKDDMPHMFERFFRAKTAEGIKGTGIGLSVVKEFVGIHDGTISLDSEEGKGSTFTVRLPIVDRE